MAVEVKELEIFTRYDIEKRYRDLGTTVADVHGESAEDFIQDKLFKSVKPLGELLEKLANSGEKEVLAQLASVITRNTHRTLQEELFHNFVLPMIRQWANAFDTGVYDARNEWTAKTCKKLLEVAEECGYYVKK